MDSIPASELLSRGYQARGEKRLADAKHLFATAVERSQETNDKILLAQAFSGLGQIERDIGNPAEALRYYTDSVALRRSQGDPQALAHSIRHVADLWREQRQAGKAEPLYAEALGIYRNHPETRPLDLANAIRGCALLKADLGDPEEAVFLWHEAMAIYADAGVEAGVAESQMQIAFIMGR